MEGFGQLEVGNRRARGLGLIAFALPFLLLFAERAWAPTAVEYGIIGSKPTPAGKVGKALSDRFNAVSGKLSNPSAKQTSNPKSTKPETRYYSADTTAPSGPSKFTIYSSEGVREVETERQQERSEQNK